MKRLLIVDDEPGIRETVADVFRLKEFEVVCLPDGGQLIDTIASFVPHLVFLDMDLKGDGKDRGGIGLLQEIRQRWSSQELPVIVISGVGDARLLKELMTQGADDYEVKPIEFSTLLEKAGRFINRQTSSPIAPNPEAWKEEIVGKSKVILNLLMNLWRAAQVENDILILGETGTGKDLIARTYHQFSRRRGKPFYTIDCSSIPPNLFESELFGYVPGAFTEAKRVKKGRVEEADGGIVFFNEIGDMPLDQQVKLLTLLEEKTVTRVGSNQSIQLDVRIVAATNRDLHQLMEKGLFRRDLYYRLLNQVIVSPPLRDHPEDIPLLVEHFIQLYSRKFEKTVRGVLPEVAERFQHMTWQGNVRELMKCLKAGVQNCVDHMISWQDVEMFFKHRESAAAAGGIAPGRDRNFEMGYLAFKARIEEQSDADFRDYFLHHLQRYHWNVAKSARALGMTREYFNQLIRRYGLKRGEAETPNKSSEAC